MRPAFLFETYEHQYARPVSTRGDGLFQAKPAGRPFGWEMTIQGSRERVLDSVLPHEVTHTIFATHFGRPLPRWADEGACTTVEHSSEKAKQHRMLYEFLKTNRGIAFNQMFSMNEYPADILPLYSQGFSLARYFIQQGGKRKFVKYVEDGLNTNNWTETTRRHYGYESLSELQVTWLDWVRNGSVDLPQRSDASPIAPARETPPREPNPTYLASHNVRVGGRAACWNSAGGGSRKSNVPVGTSPSSFLRAAKRRSLFRPRLDCSSSTQCGLWFELVRKSQSANEGTETQKWTRHVRSSMRPPSKDGHRMELELLHAQTQNSISAKCFSSGGNRRLS